MTFRLVDSKVRLIKKIYAPILHVIRNGIAIFLVRFCVCNQSQHKMFTLPSFDPQSTENYLQSIK